MRIPITISIFSVMLLVTTALTVVLAGYSHVSHRRSAEIAAREIMDRSAEILELKIKALIDPAEEAVQHLASWPGIDTLPSVKGHSAKGLLLNFLTSQPQISTASIGFDDGSFYMIGSARFRPTERLTGCCHVNRRSVAHAWIWT